MNKTKTRELVLCALFVPLMALGARITIPIPFIPFTLQTLFIMMAGLLLGGKVGALSVIIYTVMGLLGLPFFTEGGGISYVFKPSFGYIIGFIFGAFVTGYIARKPSKIALKRSQSDDSQQELNDNATSYPSFKRLLCACLLGLVVIYACGLPYFYFMSNYYLKSPIGVWSLFIFGFATSMPGDIVLSLLAALCAKKVIPAIGGKKG